MNINKTRKTGIDLPPFQSGQIWQLFDSNVEIGLVGKRLVHFKHYKIPEKRPRTQLSGIGVLEKFLRKHGATLLAVPSPLTAPAGGRIQSGSKSGRPTAKANCD